MTWLYTIFFAGLVLSSGNEPQVRRDVSVENAVTTIMEIQKDEIEKFEQSYALNQNGRVSVSNVNGSIVVEAWDRNEVRLEATKVADSKEALSEVEIKVDSSPDAVSVETDYKDRNHKAKWTRKLEVQIKMSVPRSAVLDEIETVNGSVTVADFVNLTKVSAVNGDVKASNLRGNAILSTVNGTVTADFEKLETGTRVSLSTVNGHVNLMIPSDSNATVKADSLNGDISNDFGLPVRKGQYVGRDMYGKIGSGEVQIKLNSVNGGLSIGRKNDGKGINPSTNLLKQKNGDENWDGSAANETERLNKTIAKVARDRKKHTEVAEKALEKMKPEMERINAEVHKIAAEQLNSDSMRAKIRDGMMRQREALVRIREAGFGTGIPTVVQKSKSFITKGIPTISVGGKGCGVRVRGWDKSEVQYVIVRYSPQNETTPIEIKEEQDGDKIRIDLVGTEAELAPENGSDRMRIELMVPKASNLVIVTSGEIRVEGVSGELKIEGADEPINIRDVSGNLNLKNIDGQVRIIGFRGELDSVTVDGDVYLEGDFEKLAAKATDGHYVLTLPQGANININSNTEVVAEGMNLIRDAENNWRIGNGGTKYDFSFTDGGLRVQSVPITYPYRSP
ncbi:MAG: DUF4097 family beta strand repeat-containing protein [Pyrinomonadaceae bacterium]